MLVKYAETCLHKNKTFRAVEWYCTAIFTKKIEIKNDLHINLKSAKVPYFYCKNFTLWLHYTQLMPIFHSQTHTNNNSTGSTLPHYYNTLLKQEELQAILSVEVNVKFLSVIISTKESRYLSVFHAVILQIHRPHKD